MKINLCSIYQILDDLLTVAEINPTPLIFCQGSKLNTMDVKKCRANQKQQLLRLFSQNDRFFTWLPFIRSNDHVQWFPREKSKHICENNFIMAVLYYKLIGCS